MIKDEKRELCKAEKHAYEVLHIIDDLQNEVMSQKRHAETMLRLRKHAGLMAQRLSKMTGRELSLLEKLDLSEELRNTEI